MAETGTHNSSTSMASQLIRELELNGAFPDPRTDTDHQSLVSLYPELGEVSAVDINVPTPEGGVPGRLYRAAGEAAAGLVWVHGGAFIAGDLDMPEAHWVSLYLASHGISVLSLDYRKALHGVKYPAPSNDVLAGWRWALENLDALGLKTAEDLHLGGASAGAALTAALTGRLRDGAGHMPASLLLAYPLVHAELPPLSGDLLGKMAGVPADLAFEPDFIRDINFNFAGSEDNLKDPLAFAGEGDVKGFPPVYIINSEADTLRASGERFAAQLEAAGVPVRMEIEPGSMHGHLDHPHTAPARHSVDQMRAWLHDSAAKAAPTDSKLPSHYESRGKGPHQMSAVTAPANNQSIGTVAPGFEGVRAEFDSYLAEDPNYSAQLAVYWKDQLVVDLVGGHGLNHDTLMGTFSATKGVAAIALGTLVGSGELDLDRPVVHYWPEFGAHGKETILVCELLSHQAGLINIDGGLETADILDSRRAAPKLAAQRPYWRPGTAFGYHGLTVGSFMEELVRRITGQTLQELYEGNIRAPRDIDFWLALPQSQEARFEPLRPAHPTAEQLAMMSASQMTSDGLGALMFNGVNNIVPPNLGPYSPNRREVRAAGPAAVGGIGSARGLAQIYAAAIGLTGDALLDLDTLAAMGQQQVWGVDRVLNFPTAFGVVFMKPHPGSDFGSFQAFGHDGAGGALGFADPLYDVSFGYIPLQMQLPGGADARALRLSQTVRTAIRQS